MPSRVKCVASFSRPPTHGTLREGRLSLLVVVEDDGNPVPPLAADHLADRTAVTARAEHEDRLEQTHAEPGCASRSSA